MSTKIAFGLRGCPVGTLGRAECGLLVRPSVASRLQSEDGLARNPPCPEGTRAVRNPPPWHLPCTCAVVPRRRNTMVTRARHCIFCDIVHGAAEVSVCYEDADTIAF